jgi:hypothetical protein
MDAMSADERVERVRAGAADGATVMGAKDDPHWRQNVGAADRERYPQLSQIVTGVHAARTSSVMAAARRICVELGVPTRTPASCTRAARADRFPGSTSLSAVGRAD